MSDENKNLTLAEAAQMARATHDRLIAEEHENAKKWFIADQWIDPGELGKEYLAYVEQSWTESRSAMQYETWYVERLEAELKAANEKLASHQRLIDAVNAAYERLNKIADICVTTGVSSNAYDYVVACDRIEAIAKGEAP